MNEHSRNPIATSPDTAEMGRRYQSLVAAGYPYAVAEVDARVLGLGQEQAL